MTSVFICLVAWKQSARAQRRASANIALLHCRPCVDVDQRRALVVAVASDGVLVRELGDQIAEAGIEAQSRKRAVPIYGPSAAVRRLSQWDKSGDNR